MSEIRTGYDRWAAVYDRDANPLIGLEEPVVREALGDVRGLVERSADAALAARFPRAEKYVGWPMLVVLTLGG